LLDSRGRFPNLAKKVHVVLHAKQRSSSSMGNYFDDCIDVAIVAEHGLDESLVVLVERYVYGLN
jgi:hypothetical protein